jgi:methylated-DNA-[protein]-cysteine S-methyltransferase
VISYVLLPSEFGTLSIVWREIEERSRVFRVFLPAPEASGLTLTQAAFPGASRRSNPAIADLAERMGQFLEGQAVDFGLSILALERCSEFQVRVLRAEHRIPRGRVSTYGRIARHLGMSKGARAVGGALARNPFPIVIPCHRAIRSDGRLGGFQGGLEMKQALLELEGLQISPGGRVLTQRFYY